MAVINSVAAIVTAYRDGADLALALRERQWARDPVQIDPGEQQYLEHLELSLASASDAVQGQFERFSHHLGEAFASGDQIARDNLHDLVIYFQKRLMSRLKIAWQQDTPVDLDPLLGVAEDVQDRAIMCMMQLHQRLLASVPVPIMERPRFKPRPRKVASMDDAHPASSYPLPYHCSGASDSFIAPAPPRLPRGSQLFGNHVEITAPPLPVTNESTRPPPLELAAPRRSSMDSTAPRIQHVPSMTSGYIPIEFQDDGFAAAEHSHHYAWKEPSHAPSSQQPAEQRFADSPTLSPARLSSIGSMSSAGSHDYDDPEYNPWSSNGTGSPISSYNGSASPLKSPYAPSLVPEALAPRRQNTEDSPSTEHHAQMLANSFQNLDLVPQHRNGSPASSGILPPRSGWPDDDASVYSQSERANTQSPSNQSCLSYYQNHASPSDTTRLDYFPSPAPSAPHASPPQPRTQSPSIQSANSQGPRSPPTYSWLPPKSPRRELVRPSVHARENLPPMPSSRPSPMPVTWQPPSIPLPRPPQREMNPTPYREQMGSSPREHYSQSPREQPQYPGQPAGIPANVTAYKWEVPRSPPQPQPATAPLPPMRAPERNSRSPTRPWTTNSSSSGSIVVLPPATAPASQTTHQSYLSSQPSSHQSFQSSQPSPHSSYHLANRRVSTVSSNNSSTSGNGTGPGTRQPPVPAPALRTIPSSAPPGNVKGCLPNEKNKFAGFCKGAWRGQIGDTKKAYEERMRPAAIGTNKVLNYYKCKKCAFEGRAMRNPAGKGTLPDSKVYGSNGILYRWEFLFKSHIEGKAAHSSPLDAHYGCMFCCATGRGTPIFSGVASLMNHLQEHRDVLPQGEIVYRMNAIVGRSPDPDEDFDVALPSLVI